MKNLIPAGYYLVIFTNVCGILYFTNDLYLSYTTTQTTDGWKYRYWYAFADLLFAISALFFLINLRWKLLGLTAAIALFHNLTVGFGVNLIAINGIVVSAISIMALLFARRLNSYR